MTIPFSAAIYFITCHTGPADHFATFAEELKKDFDVQIHAGGPALEKLVSRRVREIHRFDLRDPQTAAVAVAQKCAKAAVVITDVGSRFQILLHEALKEHAPQAFRFAYYDNPEMFVPGEYSENAQSVMGIAQGVLFANANLATYDLPCLARGVGYYPLDSAERIAARRTSERGALRAQLLKEYGLEDKGQKIGVYVGGNNGEYFSEAFPAFLNFLNHAPDAGDLSKWVIILQQHPAARKEDLDGRCVEKFQAEKKIYRAQFYRSPLNSEDAQVVADVIFYHQTSMAPQFILAGIPTIQVGPKIYEDLLVRNEFCATAKSSFQLVKALHRWQGAKNTESIYRELGVDKKWPDRLKEAIEEALKSKNQRIE